MHDQIRSYSRQWLGLSSDAKPETGVPEGSTFHSIDTGEEYIYHDGMWEDDVRLKNALEQLLM